MRLMIARSNEDGVGIDVGWRFDDVHGDAHEIWWGNTRDAASLRSLVADAEQNTTPFMLDKSVFVALSGDE